MMTKPLFSVVSVTLNHLNGLKKTHESLQNQTCLDHEWIVIDGGSTDETLSYLKQENIVIQNNNSPSSLHGLSVQSMDHTHKSCDDALGECLIPNKNDYTSYPNIRYISEKDHGIYDAMNKGIDRSTGEYIIFMNAGDCFADTQILDQIGAEIKKSQPDFIYGDALEYSQRKIVYKKSRAHDKINQGMITHHQAMLYRRTALGKYDLSYNIAADYDLTLRLLNKAPKTLYIPAPICLFESGGLSQQQVRQGRLEQFQIRKKNGVSPWKNSLIFTAQSVLYQLRQHCPKIYWRLKRR